MQNHSADLFADGFMFLEAPKWHDGALWVSDVFDGRLYSIASDGSPNVVCEVPLRPSGQGFLPDGRHLVVSAMDCKLMVVVDGALQEYADLSSHATGYVNDFAIDAAGRVYVGNFGYDYDGGDERRTSCLHRVDPDGTIATVASGVEFPNGMAIINDGRTLIVAETWRCRIIAFDIAQDGELSNHRVFAELGNRQPDGLCADAQGAIWVGCFNTGEFLRVLDGGEITDRFAFEGSAISCVIGGVDNTTLYMTTFLGPPDEIATDKRKSAVFKAIVEVPGPRFSPQVG